MGIMEYFFSERHAASYQYIFYDEDNYGLIAFNATISYYLLFN
jgi:hypothetical protein